MNTRTIRTVLILGVILLGVPASSSPAMAGSLKGTVKNSETLDPIAGAHVTVNVLLPDSVPFPTVTAPDGSYEITGIIPDNQIYAVISGKIGFKPSYTRIADLGAQDLLFDILLEPDTAGPPPPGGGGDSGNVAGTIFRVGAGGSVEGLPDAIVTFYAGGGATVTTSGGDGGYSVRIPSGSYGLAITGVGVDSLAVTGLSVDSLGAVVNAVVKTTLTGVAEGDPGYPGRHVLGQNYPNPFNPSATIRFELASGDRIALEVFDVLGRMVANLADGVFAPGHHEVTFDGAGLPGGVYYYRLRAGAYHEIKKMVLLK